MNTKLDVLKANQLWTESTGNKFYTVDKGDYEWLIEQVERVHEQADLLRKYRDTLKEIADYPKVRGIGGLMDSYNEIITLAEFAIKQK